MDLSPLSPFALPSATPGPSSGTGPTPGPADARGVDFASLLAGQTGWMRADRSDPSTTAMGEPDDPAGAAEPTGPAGQGPDSRDRLTLAEASIDGQQPPAAPAFGEAHPGGMAVWLAAWTPPTANTAVMAAPAGSGPAIPDATEPAAAPAASPLPLALPAWADPALADTAPAEAGPALAAAVGPVPLGAAGTPAPTANGPDLPVGDVAMAAAIEPSAQALPDAGGPAPEPIGTPTLGPTAAPRTEPALRPAPAGGPARAQATPGSLPAGQSDMAAAPEAGAEADPAVEPRNPGSETREHPTALGQAWMPPGPAAVSPWARSAAIPGPRPSGETLAGAALPGTAPGRVDPRAGSGSGAPGVALAPVAAFAPFAASAASAPPAPGAASAQAAALAGLPLRGEIPGPIAAEPTAAGPGPGPLVPEPVPLPPTPFAGPIAPAAAAPMALPVTELNLPTPVHAPEFTEALGLQVSVLAREGIQEAELHLNPAEMGPISVRIALDGQRAQVDFGVDSAATRALVEAGLPELASALRESGLTLTGGGVSQHARGDGAAAHGGRPGDGSPQPGAGHGRHPGRDTAPADEAQNPRPRTVRLSGGVDLYA